jgi:hypothetical protein
MNHAKFIPPGPVRAPKVEAIRALWQIHPDLNGAQIARVVGCSEMLVSSTLAPIKLQARAQQPAPLYALLWKVYESCMTRLDVLAARVKQGVDVEGSLDFVRWLQFSTLPQLFGQYASGEPFAVSRKALDDAAHKLGLACLERLNTNDMAPKFDANEIEALSEKMTRIERLLVRQGVKGSVVDLGEVKEPLQLPASCEAA